jgi:hypothetical protein
MTIARQSRLKHFPPTSRFFPPHASSSHTTHQAAPRKRALASGG